MDKEVMRLHSPIAAVTWLLLVVTLGGGCPADQATGDGDAAIRDADAWRDTGLCHCDYFGGYYTCSGGEVSTYVPVGPGQGPCGTLECSEWAVVHTCALGCLYDGMEVSSAMEISILGDASFLCEGYPSAEPGDDCYDDWDCLPQQATVTGDGTVIHVYLECDTLARMCVERPPPDIPGYLGPCGTLPPLDASDVGMVSTPDCNYCLVANDPVAGCIWQGCSVPCMGDHECPPGSLCDKTLPNLTWADEITDFVCKPGPPGVFDVGLTCL